MIKKVHNNQPFLYILIRSWQNIDNFDRCINSVYAQKYKNYKILFVDDNSGYSSEQMKYIQKRLRGHVCIFNKTRKYALLNAWEMIRRYARNDEGIIFNLDGDDWLPDENSFSVIAITYRENKSCLLTYGECLIWDGKLSKTTSRFLLDNVNRFYTRGVIEKGLYRKKPFLPLHPRTWKVWLFKKILKKDLQDSGGTWLRFAEDQAIFFPLLEMARGRFGVIEKPIYVYNMATYNSDDKKNLLGLLRDELIIRRKEVYEPLK